MYLFSNVLTARQYLRTLEVLGDFSWSEIQPDEQRDLLSLDWSVTNLADLATTAGLAAYGLPATYPQGFELPASWAITQPIGVRVHQSGATGLVTRSASETSFSTAIVNWAEVAVFMDKAETKPALVNRVPFADWYFSDS